LRVYAETISGFGVEKCCKTTPPRNGADNNAPNRGDPFFFS